MSLSVNMTVNGKTITRECEPWTTLAEFIRENLNLTGTHIGCDTSQCGACTIHMNGKAVKSCTVLAAQAEGAELVTIEGIGKADALHPMQAAFKSHHGLQCGYCTPGMIMAAIDLVHRETELTEQTVRDGLEGNICRCTGYHNIVDAVMSAANEMKESHHG